MLAEDIFLRFCFLVASEVQYTKDFHIIDLLVIGQTWKNKNKYIEGQACPNF